MSAFVNLAGIDREGEARRLIAELAEVLRRVEFSDSRYGEGVCPSCRAGPPDEYHPLGPDPDSPDLWYGHRPGCDLAAALAKAGAWLSLSCSSR